MNLAYQALVILILALPGLIFERFTHPEVHFRDN
jgi:hypothetical protein